MIRQNELSLNSEGKTFFYCIVNTRGLNKNDKQKQAQGPCAEKQVIRP